MDDSDFNLIHSRREFEDAVRSAFALAAQKGCREILLCSDDFADWPLNDRELVDHLIQWSVAGRKLTIIARSYDEIARRHARWVNWRRAWSHVVECRSNNELEEGQMPTLLLMPGLRLVRLFDAVNYRGSISSGAGEELRARELFDEVLQQSEEAFPATQLGL